jgi:hypothetical protein
MTGYDPRYGFDLYEVESPAPATPPRVPLRRRAWVRRGTKWVGILLLGGMAALLGLRLYWGYLAHRAVSERTDVLDQMDSHWRWEDILARQAALPSERNGARIVTAAVNLLPPEWPSELNRPPRNPLLLALLPELYLGPWPDRLAEVRVPTRMEESIAYEMRGELKRRSAALAEAHRLIDGPTTGRFETEWQPIPGMTPLLHVSQVHAVATLLRYEAILRAHEGKLDEALASARGVLAAGQALGDEPSVSGQSMRLTCQVLGIRTIERVLAQGEVSPEALQRTQRLIATEAAESRDLLALAARAERAYIFEFMNLLADDKFDARLLRAYAIDYRDWKDRTWDWVIGRHEVRYAQAEMLDLLAAGLQGLEMEPLQQQQVLAALEDRQRSFMLSYHPLGTAVARMFPPFRRIGLSIWRGRIILDAAEAAVAAERFRLAHGRWPDALAELTPTYLAKLPRDPFSNAPLLLRRLEDGIVIYSVGTDGTDNGGRVIRNQFYRGDGDIGFQLWDSRLRGQRPLPSAE